MNQPPFQSPSNQQAHDKVRGYAFQCWLTVDAWLQLQPDEQLYVECAEDFAVFSEQAAEVAQAKAVAASISLRSDDAIEALNHLCEFQQSGAQTKIRYSFLTTGGVSLERGDPFEGVSGIVLWQNTALDRNLGNAEKLRHFLVSDEIAKDKLTPKLAQYLASASASDFLDKFVISLVWDTGRPNETDVRAAVEGRLMAMAHRDYPASSLSAGNLADTLFTTIVTVASAKEKVALTRTVLLSKIKEALLPQAIAVMAARRQEIFGSLIAVGSGLDPEWAHMSALPPIQPANEFSPRTEALANLKSRIGLASFSIFIGSTGMGKTTLAQLYSAQEGGSWLQFQAKDERRAVRVLQECMDLIGRRVTKLNLIVDDLPWEKLDGVVSTVLRGFALMVKRGGGVVLFTNQRPPTPQELAAAGLSSAIMITVPAMTRAEIAEVALRLGCPNKQLAEAWAVFVIAHTSGHPQLVHAQLIGLRDRAWPSLSAAELQASGEDLNDERARLQVLLAGLVDGEVELLRRVSVYFGRFRRDQVLNLAQQLTPIINAGAFFERLRGPWIELVTKDYYQLSPLIHRSLLESAESGYLQALNVAVVKSVISTKPVRAEDACNALSNAIAGQAAGDASGILLRLLSSPHEHASKIRHLLYWVVWIKMDGSPIFHNWPAVDLLFRLLQFDVAIESAPGSAGQFLTYCDNIIATERIRDAESAEHLETLMAVQIIRTDAPEVPIARLFSSARVMRRVFASMPEEASDKLTDLDGILPNATAVEKADFFVSTRILSGTMSVSRLRELLDALERASPEDRTDYLLLISCFKPGLLLAVDSLWLAEEKKAQRSWGDLLVLFDEILARALEWRHDLLATAVARASVIIQHEYCNNVPKAIEILNRITPVDPVLGAVLDEQRGNIALFEKEYSEAKRLFEACLNHNIWDGVSDEYLVNCHQKAGMAAGYMHHWAESAEHFEKGSTLASQQGSDLRAFALLGDAAYARWQNGEKVKAVNQLVSAMEMTPRLPAPSTDLASLRAFKCFGHILLFLAWHGHGRKGEESMIVLPGMCSDPRPNPHLKDLPPPLVEFNWVLLLSLDFEHTNDSGLWDKVAPSLRQSRLVIVRNYILELEIRRLLSARKYGEVFRSGMEMARSFSRVSQIRDHLSFQEEDSKAESLGNITFDSPLPVPFFLLSALTLAVVRREDTLLLLDAWKGEASGTVVEANAISWLGNALVILKGHLSAACKGAAQEPDLFLRWLHVLRILKEDSIGPGELLLVTVYFALLRYTSKEFAWMNEMIREVDQCCSRKWLAACENRFAFRSPTLFIPDIKELAANPKGTSAHLSSLALAARPALSLKMPDAMMEGLKLRAKECEE